MSKDSLLKSISDGNAKRLSKLLRHGAGLKITPNDMSASLFVAIRQSREECVESLIAAGTDPNSSDLDGKPALYLVIECGRGNPTILKALLRAKANPNKVTYNTQQTPLHAAAKKGYQVCIKALMLHGACIDTQDGYGNTALIYASREGHITIVRNLLLENADPNIRNVHGETALHLAVKGNHTLCIEVLMAQGSNSEICDNNGQNALLLALKLENPPLVEMLIENQCSVNAQDTQSGKTVLHWAIQGGNLDLIIKLLNLNANPNIRDKEWQTPFLLALNLNRKDIVEHLLKAGCSITVTDRSFNTALHTAAINGQADMIPLLINKGLIVDLKGSGGMTPLMLAAFGGHYKAVSQLLQYGANSSLTDRNHASAIIYAILSKTEKKHIHEIVKVLIKSNCDINYAANLSKVTKTFDIDLGDGVNIEERLYTPLEVSFLLGDAPVFMMLIRAGCDVTKFSCDKDTTLLRFKSIHSDLKNRWMLLRSIQKERKRVKPLKELCRRPVLKVFGKNIDDLIFESSVSEKLKNFLNYSDLDAVCSKYRETNDHMTSSPNSPPYSTQSLSRGHKLRSTIHSANYPKSPATPVLPKATWANEINASSKNRTSYRPRTTSFDEIPVTEKIAVPTNRMHSTSDVPLHDKVQNTGAKNKTSSIFDFFRKSKLKTTSDKRTKVRQNKPTNTRDTINALLHGTSHEFRETGDINPKPLDLNTIQHANELIIDSGSFNRILHNDRLTSANISYDIDHNVYGTHEMTVKPRKWEEPTNDNDIRYNNVDNNRTLPQYINKNSNGLVSPSSTITDDVFFSEKDFENKNTHLTTPTVNPVSSIRKKRKSRGKIELHTMLYGNPNNTETDNYQDNKSDQLSNSWMDNKESADANSNPLHYSSQDSSSNFSPTPVKDDIDESVLESLQSNISQLAQNIYKHYSAAQTYSPVLQKKHMNMSNSHKNTHKHTNLNSTNVPHIPSNENLLNCSPLSPTSTTSKSSYDSSSSGSYQLPTGDAQLLQKYLHSQSENYQTQRNVDTARPRTLDIFTKVEEINSNNYALDDDVSHSSAYSVPSWDSRGEHKLKTNSVTSLSSTDSKHSYSKIPVLRAGWSPQPARISKIPVPLSPLTSHGGSKPERFIRSRSFRY